MSTNPTDENESFIAIDSNDNDEQKANCRRHRRSSVQFIDKNLIRRRSSGNDKPLPLPQRLTSFDATYEPRDRDHLQHYSEMHSRSYDTLSTCSYSHLTSIDD
jgi:hypothetical protein